jgi:hypothetical protein
MFRALKTRREMGKHRTTLACPSPLSSVTELSIAHQESQLPMKAARQINSSTLITGLCLAFYLLILTTKNVVSKVGVWRTMGGNSYDDRFPNSHVLPVDMPLVL